jgi:formamidopyrimidine-DNA glycosylase
MPELPEVESFKRVVETRALGKTVSAVVVHDERIVRDVSARQFCSKLKGAKLQRTRRHGKYLFLALDRAYWLVIHFGMSGAVAHFADAAGEPRFSRMRLDLGGNGHLAYTDQRLLGHVAFTSNPQTLVAELRLGPDALDAALDLAALRERFGRRAGAIKPALMDQTVLAGVGNIYSDEILFQARIHPSTQANHLTDTQWKQLHRHLKDVLTEAVLQDPGTDGFLERLPAAYLLPHREKNGRCPRCHSPLTVLKVSGRTSFHCPRCQRNPA